MLFLTLFLVNVLAKYDEALASKLFYMTSLSYCSRKHIENWTCGKPCKEIPKLVDINIFLNETSQIAGYAAYEPVSRQIYVIFRGTLPWSVKNWMEDIDFIKTDYPYCPNGCQVHRGFYNAFLGIQEQVLESLILLQGKYPDSSITITGHSLGGALANHALVFLHNNGFKITNFYTFGSPRVGDKAFFEYVDKFLYPGSKFRVTHDRDPVPHLPFQDWGFHHVNTEAFYNDILFIHKKVKICDDSKHEDSSCSNKSIANLSVMDHADYLGYNMALELVVCQ